VYGEWGGRGHQDGCCLAHQLPANVQAVRMFIQSGTNHLCHGILQRNLCPVPFLATHTSPTQTPPLLHLTYLLPFILNPIGLKARWHTAGKGPGGPHPALPLCSQPASAPCCPPHRQQCCKREPAPCPGPFGQSCCCSGVCLCLSVLCCTCERVRVCVLCVCVCV